VKLREIGRVGAAATAGRFAWSATQRWKQLPLDDRNRLQTLLRRSGGHPTRLSPAERRELGTLVRDLELASLVRGAALDAAPQRRRFGRR
jgi:hypothetical protein